MTNTRFHLQDGERIIWSGAPARGLIFNRTDIAMVPFSVMWAGFAIFWEWSVATSRHPYTVALLFGAVFVAVGLFMVAGRFFADAAIRAGTHYALTNQRILIRRSLPAATLISVNLAQIAQTKLIETASGRGTIRFGAESGTLGRSGFGAWIPSLDPIPQFIAVDGARELVARVQHVAALATKEELRF